MTLEIEVRELLRIMAETPPHYVPDTECAGPICRQLVKVEDELKKHKPRSAARKR